MYSVLLASVCVLFAKGNIRDKNLILVLITHIIIISVLQATLILTIEDYITVYTHSTCAVIVVMLGMVELKIVTRVILILTISPQVYYLYILHHPYALSTIIPMWFLLQADNIFWWGLLAILHKQKGGWKMSLTEVDVRSYLVNAGILISLILF